MKKVIKMSDKTRDSAIDWYVRMRADDVTKSTQRAHAAWLAAEPENETAYREVEASMQALDGLDEWMREELGELNLRRMTGGRWHAPTWVGLASAAVLFAAVIFWPGPATERHYETVKAEQREVSLDDGSRMRLNTATALSVSYTPTVRKVSLQKGEGLFDITPDDRPFVVHAGDVRVVAVGTQFRVYLDGNDVIVTVLEGSVAVMGSASPFVQAPSAQQAQAPSSVLLSVDQQTTVAAMGEIGAIETVNADDVTAWREGKLVFDATPLRQVVKEISRYAPGRIVVAEDVPDYPVTALLHIRSREVMLRFLSNAVPVTPVKTSTDLIVLHGNS